MVSRFLAAIEPHEGSHRRAVGKAHHVGWSEAERVDVPAYAAAKSTASNTRCPSLVTAEVRASAAECR